MEEVGIKNKTNIASKESVSTKQNVCRCCNTQQTFSQKFTSNSKFLDNSLKTIPEPLQNLVESTFSFAQLGSGGQVKFF